MSREDVKRFVSGIIVFLNEQRTSPASRVSPDGRESLEVAVQCLESAFQLVPADIAQASVGPSALQLYTEGMQKTRPSAGGEGVIKMEATSAGEEQKPSADDIARADAFKTQGNECMKADRCAEALDFYSKAIELDNKNAVFYCNRAAAQSKLGNHEEAISDCEIALNIDSSYVKAYGRMGLAFSSLNRHIEARDCYKKAVELEPDNESYRSNLMTCESQIAAAAAAAAGGNGGLPFPMPGAGGMDIGNLLSNPALMSMASQLLSDPNMQNIMSNIMSGNMSQSAGGAGGAGMDRLLQAGQQLAQQMQSANPQLVEQLRQQMGNLGGGRSNNSENGTDKPSGGDGN